uniref:PH domain-containing protein n=2 Tax=Peronospora matthiolae TaxID=2874970 RepID=A0AAV1UNA5_9STRA
MRVLFYAPKRSAHYSRAENPPFPDLCGSARVQPLLPIEVPSSLVKQMAPRQKAATAASRAVLDSSWRPSRCSYSNTYDAEVPAIMEPHVSDPGDCLARSSLLAFRSSRMVRMSQQQLQAAQYAQQRPLGVYKHHLLRMTGRKSADVVNIGEWKDDADDSSSSSETSSSDTGDSFVKCSHRLSRVTFQKPVNRSNPTDDYGTADEADRATTSLAFEHLRHDRAESVLAVMAMPVSGPIPLLERSASDDDDNDIDTIICDPSRLPRTLVVDENGFTMSRESVMVRAANLPRGGVIKSGLLFKQGFGLRYGGWKVRYVVLTSTKMTFFREEQGRKRGEIDLAKCNGKSIEIMPRDSVFDGSQASMWRFAIRGKTRRVLLSAYTESDMKEWLRCLHVALAVQAAGAGRYTDFVVPSGTFLAERGGGLMRSSGISCRAQSSTIFNVQVEHELESVDCQQTSLRLSRETRVEIYVRTEVGLK